MILLIGKDVVSISDEYEFLMKYKWNTVITSPKSRTKYVVTTIQKQTVYLHHLIIGRPPKGFEVDHRDRNGLNNQVWNLRFATPSQNSVNTDRIKINGYRGLTWDAVNSKWRVKVGDKHVGRYSNKEEAARAYDKAAIEILGDFVTPNFGA